MKDWPPSRPHNPRACDNVLKSQCSALNAGNRQLFLFILPRAGRFIAAPAFSPDEPVRPMPPAASKPEFHSQKQLHGDTSRYLVSRSQTLATIFLNDKARW